MFILQADENSPAKDSPDPTDDLFEPLTPDKSPTDLFLSDEGDDLDQVSTCMED